MRFKGIPKLLATKMYEGCEWRLWASRRKTGWVAIGIERDPGKKRRRNRFRMRYSTVEKRLSRTADTEVLASYPGLRTWAIKELKRVFS